MPEVVSRAQMFVGVIMCLTSTYPFLSAYYRSVYRYKRMRLLTRVYGTCMYEGI